MERNLKKTTIIVLDVILGIYLVFIFTAFNKSDETANICTRISIDTVGEIQNGFINAVGIRNRLGKHKPYPLEKSLKHVNTRKIENTLETSLFISTVECYRTRNGHVDISIAQRVPVVRVRSISGDDYYPDNKDAIMSGPSYTSDPIIATGYVNRQFTTYYVLVLSKALMGNELWRSQIEQIHVLLDRGIELALRMGDHIIYLGQLPTSNDQTKRLSLTESFTRKKLTRLEEFYKYGLSQVGWNKYSHISLESDNQIIRKGRSN